MRPTPGGSSRAGSSAELTRRLSAEGHGGRCPQRWAAGLGSPTACERPPRVPRRGVARPGYPSDGCRRRGGRSEARDVSGTRKIAIALLALVLLAMWLVVVFNARTTVPVPL